MLEQLADGTHDLTIGRAPADVVVPAEHPLGQGSLTCSLTISGGAITHCSFAAGSNFRSDEKLLEVRDYRQGLSLINRHNWWHPAAAEIAYAQCIEDLLGLRVPARAAAIRELICALQGLTAELRWELAQATLAEQSVTDISEAIETLVAWHESVTGARVHDSCVRVGGVANDVSIDLHSRESIIEFCRRYPATSLWLDQLMAAYNALQEPGPISVQLPKVLRVPVGTAFYTIKSFTGEVGVWLHSDGGKSPLRVSLRAPSIISLAKLAQSAPSSTITEFFDELLTTRMCLGEIER